jgi:tRNA1(Val) A37 N6-methylase TrmN6
MEVIKVKEIVEVFEELEKRYGPKWYEHVHVDRKKAPQTFLLQGDG